MKKIVDSRLYDSFMGWTAGTIYKLEDGTLWRVEPLRNSSDRERYERYECLKSNKRRKPYWPRATVVQTKDETYYLHIQAEGPRRRVVQMVLLTPEEAAARRKAKEAGAEPK